MSSLFLTRFWRLVLFFVTISATVSAQTPLQRVRKPVEAKSLVSLSEAATAQRNDQRVDLLGAVDLYDAPPTSQPTHIPQDAIHSTAESSSINGETGRPNRKAGVAVRKSRAVSSESRTRAANGVPKASVHPRWCGGAEGKDLPWKSGSKAAQHAESLKKRFLPQPEGQKLSGKALNEQLQKCMLDMNQCGNDAQLASLAVPAVRDLRKQRRLELSGVGKREKVASCAVVGNAGHMLSKKYGGFIDKHDVVIRFNIIPTTKFSANVGVKTTFRFLNKARSSYICKGAEGVPPQTGTGNENNTSETSVEDREGADAEDAVGEPSNGTGGNDPTASRRLLQVLLHTTQVQAAPNALKLPEGRHMQVVQSPEGPQVVTKNTSAPLDLKGVILWHPGNMQFAAKCLGHLFRDTLHVHALSRDERAGLRTTARNLRAGIIKCLPEEGKAMKRSMALELTSGAHAVLMLTRMCSTISVYGLSSWTSVSSTGYQYAGRANLRSSGKKYHDWGMEAAIWRMLHASGLITVCST